MSTTSIIFIGLGLVLVWWSLTQLNIIGPTGISSKGTAGN